jgi:hypothetical protein
MKTAKVLICVNSPGYLPDSEQYPYETEGNVVDIAEQVISEFNWSIPFDEPGLSVTNIIEITDSIAGIVYGQYSGWSDDLPHSNYVISVDKVD